MTPVIKSKGAASSLRFEIISTPSQISENIDPNRARFKEL